MQFDLQIIFFYVSGALEVTRGRRQRDWCLWCEKHGGTWRQAVTSVVLFISTWGRRELLRPVSRLGYILWNYFHVLQWSSDQVGRQSSCTGSRNVFRYLPFLPLIYRHKCSSESLSLIHPLSSTPSLFAAALSASSPKYAHAKEGNQRWLKRQRSCSRVCTCSRSDRRTGQCPESPLSVRRPSCVGSAGVQCEGAETAGSFPTVP